MADLDVILGLLVPQLDSDAGQLVCLPPSLPSSDDMAWLTAWAQVQARGDWSAHLLPLHRRRHGQCLWRPHRLWHSLHGRRGRLSWMALVGTVLSLHPPFLRYTPSPLARSTSEFTVPNRKKKALYHRRHRNRRDRHRLLLRHPSLLHQRLVPQRLRQSDHAPPRRDHRGLFRRQRRGEFPQPALTPFLSPSRSPPPPPLHADYIWRNSTRKPNS